MSFRPFRTLRLRLLCLLATVLFAVAEWPAQPAGAATIPGAITSITTTATTVAQWDVVTFGCTWAVPDHSQPGDTFTLQLPSQLRWQGPMDFNLTDPSGQVVATAHASASGLVVFTLTSYVTTHPLNLHGTCTLTTQYTAVQTQPGPETLVFGVGGETITVPIEDAGPCTTACNPPLTAARKDMWWTDPSQTRVQALIRTPATTGASNTVTITDTPDPGLVLDCSTARGEVGQNLDSLGRLTAPLDTGSYPATITCSGSTATISWTGLPAGEHAEFWVQATLSDPHLATYRNNGVVVMNGYPTPVWATIIYSSAEGDGKGDATSPAAPSSTAPSTTPSHAVDVPVTTRPATAPPTSTPQTAPASHAAPSAAPSQQTASLAATGPVTGVGVLIGAGLVLLGGVALLLTIPLTRRH